MFNVDQENSTELIAFIETVGQDFDIIIDDGGHTMNQQITSFKILFPALKSGGIYVIEDLHTSYTYAPLYEKYYHAPNQQPTIEFLFGLIHCVNKAGAISTCADFDKCSAQVIDSLNIYERNIESIHFYGSICFIFKR